MTPLPTLLFIASVLSFSAASPTADPCVPSPCGPYSVCRDNGDGSPSCSCVSTYIGSPPNCRPECIVHSDCDINLACMFKKCGDPCPGTCGHQAQCSIRNHEPMCTCIQGYTGDPYRSCQPKRQKGEKMDPGSWPWIAGLFYQNGTTSEFRCGATLISSKLVVTAAFCVMHNKHPLEAANFELVMGRQEVKNWRRNKNVQIRRGKSVTVQPSYKESWRRGADLAVIELDSPITFTDYVKPVDLWQEDWDQLENDVTGTIVGWGRNVYDNTATETPRLIEISIVSKESCLKSSEKLEQIVNDYNFCAGKRDGTGPCNGDRGSGMYVQKKLADGNLQWVLRGVVSCSVKLDESRICDLSHYSVVTDMAILAPWVKSSCSYKHEKTFAALDMIKLADKYYYFGVDDKSWIDAQPFCRSHGLELASIETQQEDTVMAEYMKKIQPNTSFWLGGKRSDKEGNWKWTGTGQKFSYTDWREGEPNNAPYNPAGGEECMLINVFAQGKISNWNDGYCGDPLNFVCELEDQKCN